MKTYIGRKLSLKEDEVMVFGANLQGFHAAGAAGYASFGEFGNVWRKYNYDQKPNGWRGKWNQKGKAEGPQIGTEGKSYAIPTVTRAGAKRSIPLEEIKKSIEKFYEFARSRPNLKFFVAQSAEGGLNGYSGVEMASIYSGDIPENVYFEEEFAKLLKNKKVNRVIIAGSRSIKDYQVVLDAIRESGFEMDEIVCGEAGGIDSLGRRYAEETNILIKSFPAKWDDLSFPDAIIKTNSSGKKYDAKAGMRRNKDMAEYATHLILCWNGKSPGSKNMLELAKKKNLAIFEKIVS